MCEMFYVLLQVISGKIEEIELPEQVDIIIREVLPLLLDT
jgi:hypothetical protein